MNTPGHYILNLALLGKTISPKHHLAIAIGAILPDIPIFVFYFVTKFIYQMPEGKIWSEAYYETFWQNLVALFPLDKRYCDCDRHVLFIWLFPPD
jgi:hypothetical protein